MAAGRLVARYARRLMATLDQLEAAREAVASEQEGPDRLDRLVLLMEVFVNPTRLRVMLILLEGASSPKDLNLKLGRSPKDLGKTAYHVRALADEGFIKEVRTTPVRGAVQHFYALTTHGDRALAVASELLG